MQWRIGGAWPEVQSGKAFISGSWRTLKNGKGYVSAAWRDVAAFVQPLVLALSPTSIGRVGTTSTITTSNVTATPTGGLSPFTYGWVKQSGDSITATASTAAVTTFQATGMTDLEARSAVFRCTCTDSLGTTDSEDITVSISRRDPHEPGGGGNSTL